MSCGNGSHAGWCREPPVAPCGAPSPLQQRSGRTQHRGAQRTRLRTATSASICSGPSARFWENNCGWAAKPSSGSHTTLCSHTTLHGCQGQSPPSRPHSRSTSCMAVCSPPANPAPSRSRAWRPQLSPAWEPRGASSMGAAHNNMHPAVIMQRINGAHSLWGLNEMWLSCGHSFTSVHCTAALLKLATLSQLPPTFPPQHSFQPPSHHSTHLATYPGFTTTAPAGQPPGNNSPAGFIPAAAPAQPHPLLGQLLQLLQPQLHSVDCCGLANTVQALGIMRHHDTALLQELLKATAPKLHLFTLPQLATLMRGFAQLQCRPDTAWLFGFYTATAARLGAVPVSPAATTSTSSGGGDGGSSLSRPAPPSQAAQQPSQLVRPKRAAALHALPIQAAAPLPLFTYTAAAAAVVAVAAPHTASCVVGCLWGLQQLACCPPPDWVALLVRSVDPAGCTPKEAAGLIHALARLQYAPASAWITQLISATQQQLSTNSQPPSPSQHTPAGQHTLADVSGNGAGASNAAAAAAWRLNECVLLVWGLAKLRVRLPVTWLITCKARILLQLPGAQPRQLVMLLHALALLQGTSSSHMQDAHGMPQAHGARGAMGVPRASAMRRRVGTAHAAGLSRHQYQQPARPSEFHPSHPQPTISSGGALPAQSKVQPASHQSKVEDESEGTVMRELDKLLVDSVLAQVLRCCASFRPRDLLLVLLYCGRLRLRPSHTWVTSVLPRLQPHLGHASALDLAHAAYGLARTRVTPDPSFLRDLQSSALAHAHTFSPQQLANLCWGLAHLRATPSRSWLEVFRRCAHVVRDRLLPCEVRQLRWALRQLSRGRHVPKARRMWLKPLVRGAPTQQLVVRLGSAARTRQ